MLFEDLQQVDQLLARPTANAATSITPPRSTERLTTSASASRIELSRMIAIAVGAFANQIVALGGGDWVVIQRPVVAADVAGEQNPQRRRAVADFDFDHRRAEQVAGVVVAHPDRLGGREPFVARDCSEELDRFLHVAVVVQRQRGLVLREALAVGVFGVVLLAVGRVEQDDFGELIRGLRCR